MPIFFVELNDNVKIKSFATFELAFEFAKKFEKTDDTVKIYHEEFIDEFHGSETSCILRLVYSSNKIK